MLKTRRVNKLINFVVLRLVCCKLVLDWLAQGIFTAVGSCMLDVRTSSTTHNLLTVDDTPKNAHSGENKVEGLDGTALYVGSCLVCL